MAATTTQWDLVWERARASAHTIVIGQELPPLAPGDLQMLWIGCDAGCSARDPLGEALRRIEKLLGEDALPPAQARASCDVGLPERRFDNLPAQSMDVQFVEACNRLAEWTGCNVVVGFETLNAADEATIMMLMQILRHPGWLRLPMILTIQCVVQGSISELIDVLRRAAGDAAVIELQDRLQRQRAAPHVG